MYKLNIEPYITQIIQALEQSTSPHIKTENLEETFFFFSFTKKKN